MPHFLRKYRPSQPKPLLSSESPKLSCRFKTAAGRTWGRKLVDGCPCLASSTPSSVGCHVQTPPRGPVALGPSLQQQQPRQGSRDRFLPGRLLLPPGVTSFTPFHVVGSGLRESSEVPISVPSAGCDGCVARFWGRLRCQLWSGRGRAGAPAVVT